MSDPSEPTLGVVPQDRLVGVELRHLAALEAIGREGSFRGAADSLGYVQSAVSHQVAALERLVGARLVERQRGNSPVSLTEAGRLLLEHAEGILLQFRAAQEKLSALAEGRAGSLRVGAFQSVAANVLPRIMAAFARACPEFRIVPTETQRDTLLFGYLEQGELDLAFCELPLVEGPFDGVELMDDPFVLLVSGGSPLAALDDPPRLEQIGRMPMIGFNHSRAQDRMLESLAAHGVSPRFSFLTDLNPTLQALVAADIGVAIVPYLTIDPLHPGTTVIELPELPARTISLIWHRERELTQAASTFTDLAKTNSPKFRIGNGVSETSELRAAA